MNRAARRNAKNKRKAFQKAMNKKQPSNDTYKEPYHYAIAAFDEANANSICNAHKFKVFTNSRGGQMQLVSTIEPHYENFI
tara:strand:+ start:22 stop:264 length:243 start_codon:yes stop_codon:yes gene_type:complete